jgi:XTP/dITP diphosphohydrolase
MHRFVFATFNRGKVREVAGILSGLDIEVLSPTDLGVTALAEETGETFLDNAVLKAAGVFVATGLSTFADDSGLEVAALDGAPGVNSARYAGGEGHDDAANIVKLLSALRGVPDRRARFVCTVACLLRPEDLPRGLPDPLPGAVRLVSGHPSTPAGAVLLTAQGEVAGRIIDTPRGTDGFGYDPIFWRDDLERTFAELTAAEKNGFSHRGHAFRALREALGLALAPVAEDRR